MRKPTLIVAKDKLASLAAVVQPMKSSRSVVFNATVVKPQKNRATGHVPHQKHITCLHNGKIRL